jgi:hypothetical protein
MIAGTQSFSWSHTGIAVRNEAKDLGKVAT